MRALILSDIHGNIDALEAVLADAAGAYETTICLGDIVGYGAAPLECLNRLDALAPRWQIRGNHDRVCAGITEAYLFSPLARVAIEWTRQQLPAQALSHLRALPHGPIEMDSGTLLCHGAPDDEDRYLLDGADARHGFDTHAAHLCLHGHTHAQTLFRLAGAAVLDETPVRRTRHAVALAPDSRYLINPGSVGQPRDGDPRAAYAILDTVTRVLELRRTGYDIASAQARIRDAGLPDLLATRLAIGE